MVQSHTTISIDTDILKKAQNSQINISDAAERGIKEKLNLKDVIIPMLKICSDCKREGPQETADDIKRKGHFSSPDKMTWLWPDEIWICNKCLRVRVNQVPIGQK